MITRRIYMATMIALTFYSCQDSDSIVDLSPNKIFNQTDIFPQPPNNWMGNTNPYYTAGYVGDVMPYYENGKFNLFFLHDAKTKPSGEGFHDIHRFETTNFIDFNYDGRQIPYGSSSDPDFGVGTGSVIKVGSLYYFYYSGHNEVASFLSENPRESILLATSPDMKTWTKVKNFKITAPTGYYNYEFRDPQVFFNSEDGKYWMLVSAQTSSKTAVILKFTTTDVASGKWTVDKPIYSTTPAENYIMLECPDIFKIGSYWYLVFSENWSNNSGTHYRIATSPNGPWVAPTSDKLDGSYFYAGKTVSDNKDRYLVGWVARKVPENNTGSKNWAGNLVTHKLMQNSDGTLAVQIAADLQTAFGKSTALSVGKIIGNISQNNNSFNLSANSQITFGKLQKANQITFTMKNTVSNGKSGLILAQDNSGKSGFKISFEHSSNRISSYVLNNGNEDYIDSYPLTGISGTDYNITAITSNDVCVVYVNDKIAFSNRVYNIAGNNWSIFSSSGSSFNNVNIKTSDVSK